MIYDEFKLADDHTVIFGDLMEDDLPKLNSVYNSIVEEGKYFLRNRGPSSVEEAQEWLQQHLQAGLTYVAVKVNGELVGGATIEPREGKASHVAYFGIFLEKEFHNLGMGTRLTRKMMELAREKRIRNNPTLRFRIKHASNSCVQENGLQRSRQDQKRS